jgi:thioredoxin reductase
LLPHTRHATPFAAQLGCELDEGPMGPFIKTDALKETTVRGVFACGDVAAPVGSVSYAVAEGVRAGTAAHQSLVFRREGAGT